MAKKVLILSSSPRRGGNSDVLCDEFMKGALEEGNEVEKIFLKDKTVNPCTGCSVCSMYGKPCRRCHRNGNTGLFLYYVRTNEDNDRSLLRTVYGNKQQGILFYHCGS